MTPLPPHIDWKAESRMKLEKFGFKLEYGVVTGCSKVGRGALECLVTHAVRHGYIGDKIRCFDAIDWFISFKLSPLLYWKDPQLTTAQKINHFRISECLDSKCCLKTCYKPCLWGINATCGGLKCDAFSVNAAYVSIDYLTQQRCTVGDHVRCRC